MAAPVIRVTENPQFIAMKTASVAPMTDSAPFMPHAQGTRAESFAVISRMPAGSGIPISTPAGAMSSTVSAMRSAWLALMAARMIGGSAKMARIATPTTPRRMSWMVRSSAA